MAALHLLWKRGVRIYLRIEMIFILTNLTIEIRSRCQHTLIGAGRRN